MRYTFFFALLFTLFLSYSMTESPSPSVDNAKKKKPLSLVTLTEQKIYSLPLESLLNLWEAKQPILNNVIHDFLLKIIIKTASTIPEKECDKFTYIAYIYETTIKNMLKNTGMKKFIQFLWLYTHTNKNQLPALRKSILYDKVMPFLPATSLNFSKGIPIWCLIKNNEKTCVLDLGDSQAVLLQDFYFSPENIYRTANTWNERNGIVSQNDTAQDTQSLSESTVEHYSKETDDEIIEGLSFQVRNQLLNKYTSLQKKNLCLNPKIPHKISFDVQFYYDILPMIQKEVRISITDEETQEQKIILKTESKELYLSKDLPQNFNQIYTIAFKGDQLLCDTQWISFDFNDYQSMSPKQFVLLCKAIQSCFPGNKKFYLPSQEGSLWKQSLDTLPTSLKSLVNQRSNQQSLLKKINKRLFCK